MLRRLACFFLLFQGSNAWLSSSRTANKNNMVKEKKLQIRSNPALTIPEDAVKSRRAVINGILASSAAFVSAAAAPTACWAIPTIDVNNAMAREFTAFPGLYPTIATKIVMAAKEEPFKSKKDIYALLNDVEQERLKQYDKSLIIAKPDKAVQQFKTSQICKYECGGRTSSSFRDEQIKDVQRQRSLDY